MVIKKKNPFLCVHLISKYQRSVRIGSWQGVKAPCGAASLLQGKGGPIPRVGAIPEPPGEQAAGSWGTWTRAGGPGALAQGLAPCGPTKMFMACMNSANKKEQQKVQRGVGYIQSS